MNVNIELDHLHRKCPKKHFHVRVGRRYTKASATYMRARRQSLLERLGDHLRPLEKIFL